MSSPPEAEPAAGASPPGGTPPAPPKRPNGRPRRGPIAQVYRAIYWTFVAGVLGSISLSVTWHVLLRAPSPVAGSEPLDAPACRQEVSNLYGALRDGARTVLFEHPVPSLDMESEWRAFTTGWRTDFERLRARCPTGVDADTRHLVADVERMQVAWSTAIGAMADVGRRPITRLPDLMNPIIPVPPAP